VLVPTGGHAKITANTTAIDKICPAPNTGRP
jgi:hypothetical protein